MLCNAKLDPKLGLHQNDFGSISNCNYRIYRTPWAPWAIESHTVKTGKSYHNLRKDGCGHLRLFHIYSWGNGSSPSGFRTKSYNFL